MLATPTAVIKTPVRVRLHRVMDEEDKAFLQQVLRSAEGDDTIVITGTDASPCCKDGENYMALVSRIKLSGTRGQDRQGEYFYKNNIVIVKFYINFC